MLCNNKDVLPTNLLYFTYSIDSLDRKDFLCISLVSNLYCIPEALYFHYFIFNCLFVSLAHMHLCWGSEVDLVSNVLTHALDYTFVDKYCFFVNVLSITRHILKKMVPIPR